MAIKIYKPYTPTTRNKSGLDFSFLSKKIFKLDSYQYTGIPDA